MRPGVLQLKIVLISNYQPDRQESMLRYANMLGRELESRGHTAAIAYPRAFFLRVFSERAPFAKWLAYIDKYLLAPFFLRSECRGADVVHVCDHSNSMYLPLAGAVPSLITCHDLLAVFSAQGKYPEILISATGRLLQRWIASGLRRAPQVVCVSRKTQDDLSELAAGHPPPSAVVYNPLNWDFHPVPPEQAQRALAARGLHAVGPYLLHIGNNSWYKNRPAVVRIFSQLKQLPAFADVKLLLAGKPFNAELRALVASSGVEADIFELEHVSNEELRALYSGALALLFPSRHEGFGWPILEAQACGCAVITTQRPPMTEVAGDAAILIDPDQPAAAAATIASQLDRLPALRIQGLENASRFSTAHAIDGYVAAYEQAILRQRPQAR